MEQHPEPTTHPLPLPDLREYLNVLLPAATKAAARFERGVRGHADDLVQRVLIQAWERFESIGASYVPGAFANVAIRHRAEDHRRSERIQRGQGAREIRDADGTRRPARVIESYDKITESAGDVFGSGADIAESVCASVDVQEALSVLDPTERFLVVEVGSGNLTMVEAAKILEISRSTAHRRYTAGIETVRDYVTAA